MLGERIYAMRLLRVVPMLSGVCLALGCATHEKVQTWSFAESAGWLSAVWGSASDNVYAVGLNGLIMRSRDEGRSWSKTTLPAATGSSSAPWLTGVGGSARDDVYAVGEDGTIIHSTDDGATWTRKMSGVDSRLFGLWVRDRGEIYAVGEKGTVIHSDDGGATWQRALSGSESTLWDVWGSGTDDVYIAGGDSHIFDTDPPANGVILHSVDRGRTWIAVQPAELRTSMALVWGTGADDVFAGGNGGVLLRSRDRGRTWTSISTGHAIGWGAMWAAKPSAIYLAGGISGRGTLLRSPDGGTSFETIVSDTIGMAALWGTSDGQTIYVAGSGGLLIGRTQ